MNEVIERRGPGRPPKFHERVAVEPAPAPTTVEDNPRKSARKPFGSTEQKLAYPAREGYHRHWFNDTAGRIGRAHEAGYEHVKADGNNVSRVVGTAEGGGALTAFLMEIPEEWYQEDMAREQTQIDEKEASMQRGVAEGKEGEGQYVPKQGISIRRGA